MAYGKSTKRIPLSEPEYWVEFKPKLSWGFAQRLSDVKEDDNLEKISSLLVHCIHAWNIEQPCAACSGEGKSESGDQCPTCSGNGTTGDIAPITAETVRLLLPEDLNQLVKAVNEANAATKEETSGNANGSPDSSTGSTEKAALPMASETSPSLDSAIAS